MCLIIVQDMIYISWLMKKADRKVTLFCPFPEFGAVQCGCDTLTLVSLLWNHYSRGSKLPPEASSRFIWIHVHWLFLGYCPHLPETCLVLYLEKKIVWCEPIWGSLTTMSPNIPEWSAITWWDFTSYRVESTWAITVWHQLVHLTGHRLVSQLMI